MYLYLLFFLSLHLPNISTVYTTFSFSPSPDVFHKECLNQWASQLPPNTAPAGYKCPACSKPVFPASNLVSPVADYLRNTLAAYPWARTGLGLPLVNIV